jgi:hypothetical protein
MNRHKKKQGTKQVQARDGHLPLGIDVDPAPASQPCKHKTNPSNEAGKPKSWFQQAREPIGLATIAIAVTGVFQLVIISQQLATQREDERAWVGIKSMGITVLQPMERLKCEVRVINSGKSFALRLTFPGGVQTSQIGFEDALAQYKKRPQGSISHAGALFPNIDQPIPSETSEVLSANQVADVVSGTLHVYLFGEVNYRDIFKEPHFTQYCGHYVPATLRFEDCGEYDDAN